jgi:NADPH:quinone reductase-like Zn-dependent oxidoreductase
MTKRVLPTHMRALATVRGGVELVERALPAPRRGELLVRMRAAPINPNDLMFLDGNYEVVKPLGAIAGFEGTGTAVASGGGLMARALVGRDVACATTDGDGTWAEYTCVPALQCAPLGKRTDRMQAAMLLTNPLTARVLLDTARRGGHRAIVQNAAAGALGRMIVRECVRAGIPLVNIVRRDEQAAALRAIGAEHVVVGDGPDADAQLRDVCDRLRVSFGLDAIGGAATGRIANAIRPGGEVVVYGMLSAQPLTIDGHAFVFRSTRATGFTMHTWVERSSMWTKLRAVRAAERGLASSLRSEIRATHPLADYVAALAAARGASSDGKVLFTMST